MWKAFDFVGGLESKEKCPSEIGGKMVVVAVKATREISRKAMVWALTHVVQPGDSIKLLVVIPSQSPSKKIWGFTRFTSDCTAGYHRSFSDISLDQKDDITNSCSEIMHQLYDVYDPAKIKVRLKIVPAFSCGVVAAEAKRANSNWVILDNGLKNEAKICIDEMQCNVVVMNKSKAKVLRLNLIGPQNLDHQANYPSIEIDLFANETKLVYENMLKGPVVTPASSPDREDSALTVTEAGTSSISSSDHGNSPSLVPENHKNTKKKNGVFSGEIRQKKGRSDPDRMNFQNWIDDIHNPHEQSIFLDYKALLDQLSEFNRKSDAALSCKLDLELSRSVREAISLSRNIPPNPPPLCSICHHKAPVFGSPPRWFSFSELESATDGFSKENFLAEGGYGSVHRGTLPDGQVIAVKQHKLASSQGDIEFCAEVEVLSCAQHRNLVTLIGFCVEDGRRLLVYEYICNGSLDAHLYGKNCRPLDWSSRQKIALGAARGLRYLHEECRVGCIVHRDLRPNNILLTHEFEPLVGDFGLARWQPDGDSGVDTRIIGTFGYLAPEYVQSGQITEKADVYSFGIVLVELITGRKAMDIDRPKGQQCLTEWARPLLEKPATSEMIDPKLNGCYVEEEVLGMLQCASLCIRRDPSLRPRMSQVLRMLEGDSDLK